MTREELDDEADRHFREQLAEEEEEERGRREAAIWGVRVLYIYMLHLSIGQ